jgi:transcriptional regulator GlxA family with amidase domain
MVEGVRQDEFTTHDPDQAPEWLRTVYADHEVKMPKPNKNFVFTSSSVTLDELTSGPQTLRRALAFIDEHAAETISLTEIAHAAGLSSRGLQATFRRNLNTTPLAYLRAVRLERAHRDLVEAEPEAGPNVAKVAARWGFNHLGRFATAYRRRFKVYPSQTLRS